jgi:hypothetical protein
MAIRPVLLALAASLVSALASAQVPPPGWRFAVDSDGHIDADRVTLESTRARADFDGNGTADHAAILVRESDTLSEHAVVAFLMLANGKQSTHQLLKCATSCGEVALTVTRSGCFTSELTNVTVCLDHPGFALFEIEFGYGTLYWHARDEWNYLAFARGELGELQ